jgi:hypothetical protein
VFANSVFPVGLRIEPMGMRMLDRLLKRTAAVEWRRSRVLAIPWVGTRAAGALPFDGCIDV